MESDFGPAAEGMAVAEQTAAQGHLQDNRPLASGVMSSRAKTPAMSACTEVTGVICRMKLRALMKFFLNTAGLMKTDFFMAALDFTFKKCAVFGGGGEGQIPPGPYKADDRARDSIQCAGIKGAAGIEQAVFDPP